MENQSPELYILDKVWSEPGKLFIRFSKNYPPYLFNDQDPFPIMEITVESPTTPVTEDELRNTVDPYSDGVTVEFVENKQTHSLRISDQYDVAFIIKGETITRQDLPYTAEQFQQIAAHLEKERNSEHALYSELLKRVNTLYTRAYREINSADRVIESRGNADAAKWIIKRDVWNSVLTLLNEG